MNVSTFELAGSVAALYVDGPGDVGYSRVWYHGFLDSPSYPLPLTAADAARDIRSGAVEVGSFCWNAREISAMLNHVDILTGPDSCLGDDPKLFCWNGVRGTFREMAAITPVMADAATTNRCADIAALAKRSYDPCFQFIRTFGFPARLENVALVMLDEDLSEPEDLPMTHSDIDKQDAAHALEFLAYRVEATSRLIKWIRQEGGIRWKTQKGTIARRELSGWRSVKALMETTYGVGEDGEPMTEPRRWPDYEGQYNLPKIAGWMKGEL